MAHILRETFQEYLDEPSEKLAKLTECMYTGIINFEILEAEKELNLENLEDREIVLFLDTTILVALLCGTDRRHPVVSELIKLCKNKDYTMYYLPRTTDEMESFVRGCISEMKEYGGRPPDEELIQSQFVEDWWRQDVRDWIEYKADIKNWQKLIEAKGITEYTDNITKDEGVFSMVETQTKMLDKAEGDDDSLSRDEENYRHDAEIISKVYTLRKKSDKKRGLPSPIFLTIDNLVSQMNEMGNPEFWEDHMIVQPREWLNYMLTYTTASYDEDQDEEEIQIGKSILKTAVSFDQNIEINNIDEFVDLMAPKMGLSDSNEDGLKQYLQTIGFDEEIERSLKEKEGGKAENKLQEATSESALDLFGEISEKDDKLKKASQQANEYKEKWQREKQRRKQAEKDNSSISEVDVTVNTSAIAESHSQSEADATVKKVNDFIDVLDSNLDQGIEGSDAPQPQDEFNSPQEIRNWLNDVSDWLNAAESVGSAAKSLAPYAAELATNLPA